MTDAAQFIQQIRDWQTRARAGQVCGIVGCQAGSLEPCALGCGNGYCAEHRKIHVHAGPVQQPSLLQGLAGLIGVPLAPWQQQQPLQGVGIPIPRPPLPQAALPRPVPPKLRGGAPDVFLNDQGRLVVLSTAISAAVTSGIPQFRAPFEPADLRTCLRYTADMYRATLAVHDGKPDSPMLLDKWEQCPLDFLGPLQATAFHHVNCAVGFLIKASGLRRALAALDYVTETDKFWDKLQAEIGPAMEECLHHGDSVKALLSFLHEKTKDDAWDEEDEEPDPGEGEDLIEALFEFPRSDPENWSIDMSMVPKCQVQFLAEAMADAAKSIAAGEVDGSCEDEDE